MADDIKYTNFNVPNLLGKETSNDKQESIERSHAFNDYKNLMNAGKPFVVEFTRADKEGNLSTTIDGVEIILPYKNIFTSEDESDDERKYKRAGKLAYKYEVTIVGIDEENFSVTVEYKGNRLKQRQAIIHKINDLLRQEKAAHKEIAKDVELAMKKMRLEITHEINESGKAIQPKTLDKIMKVKKHSAINAEYAKRGVNRIIVDALVRKVFPDGILIDIKGYGIPGYVPAYYWSYTFVSSMENFVHEGDIVSVEIIGYAPPRINKDTIDTAKTKISSLYLCARTPLIDNPWEKIKFEKGDIVKLTCTSLSRSHWFGTTPGYDMEFYCEYPDHNTFGVYKGETYECYIKKVDPEKLLITAKPFLNVRERHD